MGGTEDHVKRSKLASERQVSHIFFDMQNKKSSMKKQNTMKDQRCCQSRRERNRMDMIKTLCAHMQMPHGTL